MKNFFNNLIFGVSVVMSIITITLASIGGIAAVLMALWGLIEYLRESPDVIWWFEYAFYTLLAAIVSAPLANLFVIMTGHYSKK